MILLVQPMLEIWDDEQEDNDLGGSTLVIYLGIRPHPEPLLNHLNLTLVIFSVVSDDIRRELIQHVRCP